MISRETKRVDQPAYVQLITDPTIVDDIAPALICNAIEVPTKVEEAKKYDEIRNQSPSLFLVRSSVTSPHGLLGQIWLKIGEEEIKLNQIQGKLLEGYGLSIRSPYQFGVTNESWLEYFLIHKDFWTKALEAGAVDVIYRPDQSLAKENPRLESMIGLPIIFYDVPLIKMVPKEKSTQMGRNGPVVDKWRMSPINEMIAGRSYTAAQAKQFHRPDPVVGERLKTE